VLDIGCGWGGLALYAAEFCRAQVTGITLSQEQLAAARAGERELGGRVSFHGMDYRDVAGTFDRIVSVGMLEHVGVRRRRACAASSTGAARRCDLRASEAPRDERRRRTELVEA
jgi:cyclopropane fatty-acyl-phospholipid synthase-like methyltransferase